MNYYFPIYAILLIVGGVIGFKKAGSKVSLYAGVISGVVVGIGICMQSLGLICAVSLLLTGSFAVRLVKTKKFMPSGMLLIASLAAVIISVREFITK